MIADPVETRLDIEVQLRNLASIARNFPNDGYDSKASKHQLYLLKCMIEDLYRELPRFDGEEAWEQQRLIELLRRR